MLPEVSLTHADTIASDYPRTSRRCLFLRRVQRTVATKAESFVGASS